MVIPVASVEAVVNPYHLPVYSGPTGSLEGTIRVVGPEAPDVAGVDFSLCPAARATYGKMFRAGPPGPGADGARPLRDALVAVTGYSGYYLPERNVAASTSLDGCVFDARTIAMTFGQRLEVANTGEPGKELWAPVLAQAPQPALMLATAHGDPVRLYPPRPGYYTLADAMKHAYAHADVYVLQYPLHTVTDASGHYRIDGVPVGKLKVNARLAALNDQASADVEIRANVVQAADLTLHYTPKVDAGASDAAVPHIIP